MAYEERKITQQKSHSLSLEDRKNLSVTGVERVDSFDETEIIMLTEEGNMIIRGSDMHIGKLDLAAGEATVTGLINEVSYEEVAHTGSLWARLFH